MEIYTVQSKTITIAVAANFSKPMALIIQQFELETGFKVTPVYGSSGRFFAQIRFGAPFDMLFSADQAKIDALIDHGAAKGENRFSYAIGRLAFIHQNILIAPSLQILLNQISHQHIAIANPKLAPYGQAAIEVLTSLNLLPKLEPNLIYGENISQTYQFIDTGAVDFGFVALSQIQPLDSQHYYEISTKLHKPIIQDAIILNRAHKNNIALAFKNYMSSEYAIHVIQSFGYQVKVPQNMTMDNEN